ncbi:hypothetical protein BG000_010073 [Podila horticola]|nr:hypothetical protein BG000_010073 [Podila horticola]
MTFEDAPDSGENGNSTTGIGDNSTSPWEAKSLAWQSEQRRTCLVMRTRAIVALVWAALVFLELALAVWSGEFKPKRRRRGLGMYGAQGTLDKMSSPLTSHMWSEEGRDEDEEEEIFEEELEGQSGQEDEDQSQISIADSFPSDVGSHDQNGEGTKSQH